MQYQELCLKIENLKKLMLATVDFEKPYKPVTNCVEYLDVIENKLKNLDESSDPNTRFGALMSIVQMARGLYDTVDWYNYPKVDTTITDIKKIAEGIINSENLLPNPKKNTSL
ncbi:hypothetical protein [Acidocella facilis]|uniref:hypothetical protein n=1 Tax=Acidocella facilis TaxID=525 RepID=UPI0012DCA296|nr:hypothetical protein [Acidocella facilis]